MEDVVNSGQQPKSEGFDDGLFLVAKMLRYGKEKQIFISEQLSMVLGDKIEDLEEEVLGNTEPATMEKINALKREMNNIRKSVRPAREAVTP
jgi:magnesium transporter